MTVPAAYLSSLANMLKPLAKGKGAVTWKTAEQIAGKVGRLSHVVPLARPYAQMCYAALAAAKTAARGGAKESSPSMVAARRFQTAARWILALITGGQTWIVPLCQDVYASSPPAPSASVLAFEFDASTTGGGGVLWANSRPIRWWQLRWTAAHVHRIAPRARTGEPAFQTFWEYLALFISLLLWARPREPIAIIGDNTGALQLAIDLNGENGLLAISREVAWRRARHGWTYGAGHLPTEANSLADALSRLVKGERVPLQLRSLQEFDAPDVSALWVAASPPIS